MYFTEGKLNQDEKSAEPFVYSANHHKGNAAFVTVDLEGETGREISEFFGVSENNTLMAVIPVGEEDVEKYLYTGAWNQEDVRVWIQTFLDGKLERHFKSEELPIKTDSPVKYVVGKNYEEIVHRPNSHVLIEFYAPWCHHCKKVIDLSV